MLAGGYAAPVAAALVNGTLAHCLDYDDTHIDSILHGSGCTWAATLAAGASRNASERLLSAFITGFEVGTRVGSGGSGVRLNHSGWHTTCVLGRYSSAASAAALLGLDALQVKYASDIAATQVGGLTASVGTMAKPFHAGKTASDGVLAAELAANGFDGAVHLLDSDKGLMPTLFQDASVNVVIQIRPTLESRATASSCTPRVSSRTVRSIVRSSWGHLFGRGEVVRIRAAVNPLAIKMAGHTNASTSNEGKFSLAGHDCARSLLAIARRSRISWRAGCGDRRIQNLAARVETIPADSVERTGRVWK